MATSDLITEPLNQLDDCDLKRSQDRIIEALGGIRNMIELCVSKTEAANKESRQLLTVLNSIKHPSKNQSDNEFEIESETENDDEKLLYYDNDKIVTNIESKKLTVMAFCSKYSNINSWKIGKKEKGIQKYVLKFTDRKEGIQVRMSFLYSMTLYLCNIIGINKRCISHAFILCKSSKSQIETLSQEFELINKTLLHHGNDALYVYFYLFMTQLWDNFRGIEKYIGNRTDVDFVLH